nr:MAG TPA: hypothetical protein [Caudoviricetes sp.]
MIGFDCENHQGFASAQFRSPKTLIALFCSRRYQKSIPHFETTLYYKKLQRNHLYNNNKINRLCYIY